jgi:short-subunit dehydrogenase
MIADHHGRAPLRWVGHHSQTNSLPQHIVITGGSSGLGAALAQLYAEDGQALTLIGRDPARLDAVVRLLRSRGAEATPVVCDVTDGVAMERELRRIDSQCAVDVVIANAGLGGANVLAGACGEPAALARQILAVNSIGVINTVAPLLDRFVARHSGHAVLIGSLAAFQGLPQSPAYSASKAAIRAYGHGLRRLLSPHGIRITVVSPGFIETPMSASLPFPLPFAWSAERAAARIKRGVERGHAEIIFPWQLRLMASLLQLLPASAGDRVLRIADAWVRR